MRDSTTGHPRTSTHEEGGSSDLDCQRLLVDLRRFVSRWRDAETRQQSEDLVQDALMLTWCQRDRLHDRGRAAPYARTILRRLRYQLLQRSGCPRARSLEDEDESSVLVDPSSLEEDRVCIEGELLGRSEVLQELDHTVRELPGTVSELLLGFYGGEPASDLAHRHSIPRHLLKAHLYRGRLRLRRRLLWRLNQARVPVVRESGLGAEGGTTRGTGPAAVQTTTGPSMDQHQPTRP